MSVLTKVFVVLVAFLSVLLVALIVPFVAKTEDFRAQLKAESTRRIGAEAAAREKQAEITRLQAEDSEQFTLLQAKNRSQIDATVNLQRMLDDMRADQQLLESEKAKSKADMSRLTAAANQMAQITETQRQELSQRREDAVKSSTRIIQLEDRNNELQSQLDTLDRQVRRFKEGKAELIAQIKTYESAVAQLDAATKRRIFDTDPDETSEPIVSATPIAGAIVDVGTIDDSTYVELDVGVSDGVEENMKFWVHRGGTLVGSLVIVKVDTDKSAGRMTLVQSGLEVAVGDSVLTGAVGM